MTRHGMRSSAWRPSGWPQASGRGLPVLGAENPVEAFLSGNRAVQRSVIDVLMTVTLRPQKQGRKGF